MKFRLDIPASLMMTFEAATEEEAIAIAAKWCERYEGFDIDDFDQFEARLYPMPNGTESEQIEVSDSWEDDTDETE